VKLPVAASAVEPSCTPPTELTAVQVTGPTASAREAMGSTFKGRVGIDDHAGTRRHAAAGNKAERSESVCAPFLTLAAAHPWVEECFECS
jgi:hypothetical protein